MFSGIPQPTPLDLYWRMFGTDVRVHPFFWVMAVLLGWHWFDSFNDPRLGILFLALWVLCVFVSILLHEFGHVLMGRVFGSNGHILLYSFGGLAIGSNNLRQRTHRILVLLANLSRSQYTLARVLLERLGKTPESDYETACELRAQVIDRGYASELWNSLQREIQSLLFRELSSSRASSPAVGSA